MNAAVVHHNSIVRGLPRSDFATRQTALHLTSSDNGNGVVAGVATSRSATAANAAFNLAVADNNDVLRGGSRTGLNLTAYDVTLYLGILFDGDGVAADVAALGGATAADVAADGAVADGALAANCIHPTNQPTNITTPTGVCAVNCASVDAVADVFANTAIKSPTMFYANPEITLSKDGVGQNIVAIQKRNGIQPEHCAYSHDASCLNLDIKMETGTGKTYVYTRTMYELHKRYGINKFIVAVPTLPIKAVENGKFMKPEMYNKKNNSKIK